MLGGLLVSGFFTAYERLVVTGFRSLHTVDHANPSCNIRAGFPLRVLPWGYEMCSSLGGSLQLTANLHSRLAVSRIYRSPGRWH